MLSLIAEQLQFRVNITRVTRSKITTHHSMATTTLINAAVNSVTVGFSDFSAIKHFGAQTTVNQTSPTAEKPL